MIRGSHARKALLKIVEKCWPTLILRRLWNADCVIFKSVPLDKKETVPSDTRL